MKTKKQLEKDWQKNEQLLDDMERAGYEDSMSQKLYRNTTNQVNKIQATLTQTNEIIKLIEELKEIYVRTKVSDYSEGYSNGAISVCENLLTKIKGDGE